MSPFSAPGSQEGRLQQHEDGVVRGWKCWAGPLWPPGALGLAPQPLRPGVSGHVRPHGGAAGWERPEGRVDAGLGEGRPPAGLLLSLRFAGGQGCGMCGVMPPQQARCDGPILAHGASSPPLLRM